MYVWDNLDPHNVSKGNFIWPTAGQEVSSWSTAVLHFKPVVLIKDINRWSDFMISKSTQNFNMLYATYYIKKKINNAGWYWKKISN